MPLYTYLCRSCGHKQVELRNLEDCDNCGVCSECSNSTFRVVVNDSSPTEERETFYTNANQFYCFAQPNIGILIYLYILMCAIIVVIEALK